MGGACSGPTDPLVLREAAYNRASKALENIRPLLEDDTKHLHSDSLLKLHVNILVKFYRVFPAWYDDLKSLEEAQQASDLLVYAALGGDAPMSTCPRPPLADAYQAPKVKNDDDSSGEEEEEEIPIQVRPWPSPRLPRRSSIVS